MASTCCKPLAFFYGRGCLPKLKAFRRVVLQPWAYTPEELEALRPTAALAYLSVGEEAGPPGPWRRGGPIPEWGTYPADPAHPGWVTLVVERALVYLARGFQGLFLDNLDQAAAASREATLHLLWEVRRATEPMYLLVNRGFDLLPQLGHLAHGIVFESFTTTWQDGGKLLPRSTLRRNAHVAQTLANFPWERYSLDYAPEPCLAHLAVRRAFRYGLYPLVAKERHLLQPTDTGG